MDNNADDERLPHQRVPSTVRDQQERSEGAEPAEADRKASGGGQSRMLAIVIPVVLGFIGVVLLGVWVLGEREPVDVEARMPTSGLEAGSEQHAAGQQPRQQPSRPAKNAEQAATESGGGEPAQPAASEATQPQTSTQQTTGGAAPAASGSSGAWPWFRGLGRDAIADQQVGLAQSWPEQGPREVWSVKMLGPGHAGPAIRNGRVNVLDYDQSARQDVLRCLSLADGTEQWRTSYAVEIKDNHGISRTVPATDGQHVVSLGPMGHATCVKAAGGDVVWQIDLRKAYNAKIPSWYAGQCPLLDDGKAILAPGGTALMVAIDCASGNVVWETPNPKGWKMTHASIMPLQLGGRKVYVYPASGGLVGVSAADGSLLWEFPGWTVSTANVPSAVPVGDDRFFITGGYGAGSMLLQVKSDNPTQIWKVPQSVFGSHQHTPIFHQNHLFGVAMDRQLVCLNLQGERAWSSGHTTRFGIGPYILAEGMLYVLSDDGTLVLAEASTSGYKELARAKVLPGPDAWGPMALVDGKLVCRDRDTMICLDVRNP